LSTNYFYNLAKNKLFHLCRSITGDGIRQTLKIIKKEFPQLKINDVRSGTKVFDWNIPPEWNIKTAYVMDKHGDKIINFDKNNLHILGYSTPVNKILSKNDLFKNIYSLPKQPDAIPYITSYYKKRWGFCIKHNQKKIFQKKYKDTDKFKVIIDSSLKKSGKLSYGEIVIKGKSRQEILISTYICHPSMANNEMSGPIVSLALIKYFSSFKNLDKSLRFIFIPETIGSITYLSKNLKNLKENLVGGYNLSCIGDDRQYSCMLSKYENTLADIALIESFKKLKINYKKYSFLKRGSDERQYNSPGIDLPIASIFRTKYGEYAEYHTSLDDFNLVTKSGVYGGFKVAKTAIEILLKKIIPFNKILCEPQMGKRGLYSNLSTKNLNIFSRNLMNFLQYSDGKNDLNKISRLINLDKKKVLKIYKLLIKEKLIK
jgi:aminopeptidase-like protein